MTALHPVSCDFVPGLGLPRISSLNHGQDTPPSHRCPVAPSVADPLTRSQPCSLTRFTPSLRHRASPPRFATALHPLASPFASPPRSATTGVPRIARTHELGHRSIRPPQGDGPVRRPHLPLCGSAVHSGRAQPHPPGHHVRVHGPQRYEWLLAQLRRVRCYPTPYTPITHTTQHNIPTVCLHRLQFRHPVRIRG